MSKQSIGLSAKLNDYLLSVSLREPELLRQLREETAALPMAGMQVSPEQGQFMALMAKLVNAKQYLRDRHLHRLQRARRRAGPALRRPRPRLRHQP